MENYLKLSTKFLYTALMIILAVLFLLLTFVFPGKIILPQILKLGPLSIRYYGLILVLAIAAGYWLALKRLDDYKLQRESVDNMLLTMVVSAFIGARVYHVFTAWKFYSLQPKLIPAVWNGGLSIFGAMIGGLIGLWLYKKITKDQTSLLKILDWIIPSIALGQAIGRFGNLVNYEAYGYPTNLPWKMFVPPNHRLAPFELSSFFHPLFLYESLGSLAIVYILLKYSRNSRPGRLFLLWLFLYNGMRFFLEMLRVDSVLIGGIKLNLIVSFLLALIGITGYIITNKYASTVPHNN